MSDMDDDEDGPEVDESWLGTFSDMCLLLLVFFVLMVSMASTEQIKFQNFMGSMRDALGAPPIPDTETGDVGSGDSGAKTSPDIEEFLRIREQIMDAQQLAYNEIRSYLEFHDLQKRMGALWKDGMITIRVNNDILFAPGSEDLMPEAEDTLTELLHIFQTQRLMDINIKGFTDNAPLPTGSRFNDHWELSALRAANVLRWFVDHGLPIVRLTATGMGAMEPLASNDTAQGRAQNRRVEFSLERKVAGSQL